MNLRRQLLLVSLLTLILPWAGCQFVSETESALREGQQQMLGGTAQAMETADVVLMQDDLSHVPLGLRVARKSREIIKQNIVLSLGLKLAFLGLAIPGLATLWMAVVADVGATLLVTLNGMRLLREK